MVDGAVVRSYATSPIIVIVYDVSIVYDVALLLSITYEFLKSAREKKTDCTNLWVIKPTNQVSPSNGFRVPHCCCLGTGTIKLL